MTAPHPADVDRADHLPPHRPAALTQPGVHRCPGPGCPLFVSPGHVACRACWLAIPHPLRRPLTEAFRRREQAPGAYRWAVRRTRELVHAHPRRSA